MAEAEEEDLAEEVDEGARGALRGGEAAEEATLSVAVRAVAARDEAAEWNPLADAARGLEGDALRRATARVYGAPSGSYGAGVGALLWWLLRRRRAAP